MSNRFYRDNGDTSMSIDISSLGDWADTIDESLIAYKESIDKLNEKLQLMIDVLKEFNAVIDSMNRSIAPMMCDIDDLKKKVSDKE